LVACLQETGGISHNWPHSTCKICCRVSNGLFSFASVWRQLRKVVCVLKTAIIFYSAGHNVRFHWKERCPLIIGSTVKITWYMVSWHKIFRSSEKEDDSRTKHKMPQNREVDLLNKWKVKKHWNNLSKHNFMAYGINFYVFQAVFHLCI
jgi:hypothetical protein